jgi:hypothetical protein
LRCCDPSGVAFAAYFPTTVFSDETDPRKLRDLGAALDGRQV